MIPEILFSEPFVPIILTSPTTLSQPSTKAAEKEERNGETLGKVR